MPMVTRGTMAIVMGNMEDATEKAPSLTIGVRVASGSRAAARFASHYVMSFPI
jgi:hypothetical protein